MTPECDPIAFPLLEMRPGDDSFERAFASLPDFTARLSGLWIDMEDVTELEALGPLESNEGSHE